MRSAQFIRDNKWRRFSGVSLAALWAAGLLFGASAAKMSELCIHSLMQWLSLAPLSIVGLLIQIHFSMLVTVLAVILSKPELFCIAAFIKAFFLAYFLECMILTGSGAAVLLHWLLSPTGALPAMVLLYFWALNICEIRACAAWDLFLCAAIHFAAGFAEFLYCREFY